MSKQLYFIQESFTDQELEILNKYFTNTDKPVFGLINLPDVVKGALFARYSRSNKSLRRLFLDEFYTHSTKLTTDSMPVAGMERASSLYDKMILDFGDDSVAQLGGAHIACEQVSNILTKIIEKGRIASYLEQSTRYVYYNKKINGQYHYVIPPEIAGSPLESLYKEYMDFLFDTYTEILEELTPILKKKYPQGEKQTDRAWEAIIRAKACDIVRGLLPASTRSNLGVYANGQAFEYMLVKMYASDNAEVIQYADMILHELRKIIPAFLTRVDLENRGKLWSQYIKDIHSDMNGVVKSLLKKETVALPIRHTQNEVNLIAWDKDGLDKIIQSILFEYTFESEKDIQKRIETFTEEEKRDILKKYCGNRQNRRHKPGRALETISYKFEVLSDYGAFRDLQRHRMLTLEWQKLSPRNGYIIPIELEDLPRLKKLYEKALIKSEGIYEKINDAFGEEVAQYVIPFAYRVRYEICMNLREATHFIELRSQKQGHYSYRKVCIDMHDLIINKAKHDFVDDCMKFVDKNFYDLSREDAENKKDRKL
ncbi:FAD-dependent thymidylate synthase [Parabacteroides distasonis]|uniref:FAD-dependent thymidylate synthase n=2 Tax=Parabacteroides distasonis TaxID=823 RepID=UPI001C00CC08|nr:FAD-dependent thymidylate synthase [Parabacteroides distasonis]MBT9665463.1 thymidylate synthase [Parabacteroides distasonis]